jgi:hypothetical protein
MPTVSVLNTARALAVLAGLFYAAPAQLCAVHGKTAHASIAKAGTEPQWVSAGYSGTWHDPARPGEGFVLEILDSGKALAVWFTYPPPGSAAKQAWVFAQEGVIERNRIRFTNVITTRGPTFGPNFDPAAVQSIPWGELQFEFPNCNQLSVRYRGPQAWGSGVSNLERLSTVDELSCNGKTRIGTAGARTTAGLKQLSGSWYDATHSGEGLMFQELADGRALGFWFTYDAQGEQAWTIGFADRSGANMRMDTVLRPIGGSFGANFDPSKITNTPWGRYQVDFANCGQSSLRYQSSQAEFGAGSLQPGRLTQLLGAACLDETPISPTSGSWTMGTKMPQPVSETPVAGSGDKLYVAGGYRTGFNSVADVKRYEISTDTWSTLPNLPGARDHAMAIELGGQLTVFGGNQASSGDASAGWRLDAAQNAWVSLPAIPSGAASGSATLGGKLYFGSAEGVVTEFDPRTGISRALTQETRAPRDHSQLLAFQGELWLLGGRSEAGETNAVSIFDLASETWRAGPAMRAPRGGFAAASNNTLLLVAGGEVIYAGTRLVPTVEVISAGEQTFGVLSTLPTPVHGLGGVLRGRSLLLLGGSKRAGIAVNGGEVQILRW